MHTRFVVATALATLMLSASVSVAQSSDLSGDVLAAVEIVIEAPELADTQSVKNLIEELKAEGFIYIGVNRTFLGRVRIVAISAFEIREIIMNATTSEVLRDLARGNPETLPNPISDPETFPGKGRGLTDKPDAQGNNKGGLGNSGNSGGRRQN